ncbi:MAG: MraY family glycosyltransferase [Planctomycetota bacterium]
MILAHLDQLGINIDRSLTAATEAAPGAAAATAEAAAELVTRTSIFNGYVGVFIAAFLTTIIATPLMRRLAVANGVIDSPSDPRKIHKIPVAYLGGAAVYLGLVAAIFYSVMAVRYHWLADYHPSEQAPLRIHRIMPWSIMLGMTVIMLVGLLDDIVGISPRLKIAGQLFAAAALAADQIGVQVARGFILPVAEGLGIPTVEFATDDGGVIETIGFAINLPTTLPLVGAAIEFDLVYWTGAALIALFVLGGCNASNLIDGLDGLLSGVTAIAAAGILIIALGLAVADDGPRDTQRIVLALAIMGACLGFLPHNFNPANIFLGDCGSLLLGYCTVVLILMLGDTGKTHLVIAGLVIYAIPIIDTTLAIVRRKLAGKSFSEADADHLHHMLKRTFGVKGAVFTLYGIGAGFAALGVAASFGRARLVYALILIFASYIGVTAIKIARRKVIEEQTNAGTGGFHAADSGRPSKAESQPTPEAAEPPARPLAQHEPTDTPGRSTAGAG